MIVTINALLQSKVSEKGRYAFAFTPRSSAIIGMEPNLKEVAVTFKAISICYWNGWTKCVI